MRILIYSYNYYPEPIGIAPLMTELAEGLVEKGHSVRVITAMPWYPESEIYPKYKGKFYLTEKRNGVKIQRCYIWTRQERSLRNRIFFELSFLFFSLFQAFRGSRPDIILLTVPGLPVCVSAALVSWVYHTPIVLNLQDILPDAAVHVGLINNKKFIQVLKFLEKFAYSNAKKISVIADGFTKNLMGKGVREEKIVEIPNWVDVDFIKPLPQQDNYFRREHQLEGKFVVLYSGNIALTQGLETVIDAGTYLHDFPDIVIVIVGEEKRLRQLERYRQKRDAHNVRLFPFQPREKLPEMLAAANLGLVVQKKNVLDFNMPSKIQVLLASGRAIIASVPSTGTAARAIAQSGGGLVVEPENPEVLAQAIEKLYLNPQQVEILGEKGRKFAEENYSFASALTRYEQLFTEVVKKKELNRSVSVDPEAI
jgi:colanic acid biosynthesis glycosyl transferase WcaI